MHQVYSMIHSYCHADCYRDAAHSRKEYGLQGIFIVVIVPKIPEKQIFHSGKNRLRHWFKEAATKGLAQCDRDERKCAQPSLALRLDKLQS